MRMIAEEAPLQAGADQQSALPVQPRRRGGNGSQHRPRAASVGKAVDHPIARPWRRSLSYYVRYLTVRVCILLAVSALVPALAQQSRKAQAQSDQDALVAFLQLSAPELVSHYFDLPRIPIFVIRRVIDLGDPRVVPALADAFDRETEPLPREFLAAALVRLGSTDTRYFDYVAGAAHDAVNGDISDWNRSTATAPNGRLETHQEVRRWTNAGAMPTFEDQWRRTIEIPGAVEALALTLDGRSVPILLQALKSPEFLVVREAAFGLARMQEPAAIGPIIETCRHFDTEERPWIAKSLLYFTSKEAQEAADSIISDPARAQSWRADIDHQGATRIAVAKLSMTVQWLDHASLPLDEFTQSIKEGRLAEERDALKEYVRELDYGQRFLKQFRPGNADEGLLRAVLERLEAQQSKLNQVQKYAPTRSNRAIDEAEKKLRTMNRMMQDRVIQAAP